MPSSRVFVGGMNVPAAIGRARVSAPLAELVLDDAKVTLRPRSLARVMLSDFAVRLDLVEAAFKVRGNLGASGVGFRLHGGGIAYFWTGSEQDEVLAALISRGVVLEPGTMPVRTQWTLKRAKVGSPVAALSPLFQRLAPFLVGFSVVVLIVLWQVAEEWWLRIAFLVLWAVSAATTLALWWFSRQASAEAHPG